MEEEDPEAHPLFKLNAKAKDFDADRTKERCKKYLVDVLAVRNCQMPKGSKRINALSTKCNYLSFLKEPDAEDELDCVVSYMLHWAGMTHPVRNEIFGEWVRMSEAFAQLASQRSRQRCYTLPLKGEYSNTIPPRMVCGNGLMAILNVGRVKMKNIKAGKTIHGLKNRVGEESCRGKQSVDWRESLKHFFEELKESECTPFATRVIREETGTTTRDDDPDDIALPPHLGKRKLYERWCYERGWITKRMIKARSQYTPIADYQERPHDDEEENPQWPHGCEPQRICSWSSFHNYWCQNFKNIKVQKRGADTCTDCRIFLNSLNYCPPIATTEGDDLETAVDVVLDTMEEKQQKARQHVKQYQAQRKYANECIAACWDDAKNNVEFSKRRHCLTIDMGQNLFYPALNAEQVGDTYYLTPITALVFGVNDNSRYLEPGQEVGHDHMNVYLWNESDGRRGANDITSCLLKDYRKRGFLDGQTNNELTIIADNCAGQNKNEEVIRFHAWLVEAEYFKTVTILFLVKGHTKNACDRMFNLLKGSFRMKNIETFQELMDTCNESEFVDVDQMTPNDFYDFRSTLNRYYRGLKSGDTNRSHIFTIDSEKPTTVLKKDVYDSNESREDNILPTKANKIAVWRSPEERKRIIRGMLDELERSDPPGMLPIKQVDLFRKWRKLLKPENQDITCPRPPDHIMKSEQEKRRDKGRERAANKRKRKKDPSNDKGKQKTVKVPEGRLGLTIRDEGDKVIVDKVNAFSPLIDEISEGDVIVSFCGEPISSTTQLQTLLLDTPRGDSAATPALFVVDSSNKPSN